MDNGGDFLQLCRLCLVKDEVNIPIFEEQGDIRQIIQKISSCLPVKVSREDKLPKKICDGCSYKLDMVYEFWNTTANAEKQLLTWLGEAEMKSKLTENATSAVAQQLKPAETVVKQETIDPSDIHTEENDDDKTYMFQQKFSSEEAGPSATATSNDEPPPKRARRTAAVKAQIAMDPESDDDDDSGEPVTKVEDESEESEGEDHDASYADVPSTSADDQPGPSGVGKDGADAPYKETIEVLNYLSKVGYKTYSCEICTKAFSSLPNLRRHRKTHEEKKLACNMCNKKFHQKYNLEYHVKFKHYREFSCQCNYCDQICLNKQGLILHIDNVHLNKYKFCCDKCTKGYNSRGELDRHYKFDHEGLRYSCDVCQKVFKDKSHFKIHVKSHDPNYNKPEFTCSVCTKVLSLKSYDRHMKMHSGENDLNRICDICGMVVSSKSHLTNHRRTHTGEKPYKCDFCEKCFARNETLVDHRRVHTKERPYVCGVCSKAFTQKSALNVHSKIHTGVRPHICFLCSKKFIAKSLLKNHKCSGPR